MDAVPSRDDFDELRCAVLAETDQEPNVDFATAAIVTALDLSDDAPIRLLAAKDTMGWLAHAIEQKSSGGLVRPRVRYVGPKVRHEQASDFGLLL